MHETGRILTILLLALLLFLALASCQEKTPEDLLIDDGEQFFQETAESDDPSEGNELPEDAWDFSGTIASLQVGEFSYMPNQTVATDEKYIYCCSNMYSQGNVMRFLHRIDRETGRKEIVCSKADCRHNGEDCPAFLCTGDITGFQLYGGEIWYSWDAGSPYSTVHTGHIRPDGQSARQQYRVVYPERTADEHTMWPIHPQCFLHRGYYYIIYRCQTLGNSKLGDRQTFDCSCLIRAYPMGTEEEIQQTAAMYPLAPKASAPAFTHGVTVFEAETPEQIDSEPRFRVQPYGDSVYILSGRRTYTGDEDAWETGYSLLSWSSREKELQTLSESDECFSAAFWAGDGGIRVLARRGSGSGPVMIRIDPEKGTETETEVNGVFTGPSYFAADRLITVIRSKAEDLIRRFWVMNLASGEALEMEKTVADPRYQDISKAPAIDMTLCYADDEALYFAWIYGIIRLPYADEEAEFLGLD